MINIHYTQGPEILSDISFELSTEIADIMKNRHYCLSELAQQFNISIDAIRELEIIYRKGLKRCCFCGDIFKPTSPRRIKCYKEKHFLPCVNCGKPIEVKEAYAEYQKAGGRRCPECRGKQIGTTRRNKSEEEKDAIVAKQQATMIERYGAATPLQVPEMKAKIQATIKEKYGVDNLSQSNDIQDRIRENSQKRYGVDHYSNDPEIRKRMRDGMIKKYGVPVAQQNKEVQAKTKKTNLEKYGVENVFQNAEIRDRFTANHRSKYNVDWPNQRRENLSNPEKFEQFIEFTEDPKTYILTKYANKPSVQQISSDVGLDDTTVYDKLIKLGIRDLATEYEYSMETELINFLLQMNPDLTIIKHERKLIPRREIDVYIPDLRLGFECNPTCTHNSSFPDPWGNPPKHYKYHAEKSKMALDRGIFIYHIFGYEWTTRKDIIKSQIANLLQCNLTKVYARNTYVKEVPHSACASFLDANHRQGNVSSHIRLGLYDKSNDELVSVMTFGKMRTGIGKKVGQSEEDYELVRFCNLRYTSVVGGASKLFHHFISHYTPNKVISFSDIAHTRGQLYSKLGFAPTAYSDPGYVWVNVDNDKYYNRVTCQKQNLMKLFDDVTDDVLSNSTEPEIMMNHGYARVFDSGVVRWEWAPQGQL